MVLRAYPEQLIQNRNEKQVYIIVQNDWDYILKIIAIIGAVAAIALIVYLMTKKS